MEEAVLEPAISYDRANQEAQAVSRLEEILGVRPLTLEVIVRVDAHSDPMYVLGRF